MKSVHCLFAALALGADPGASFAQEIAPRSAPVELWRRVVEFPHHVVTLVRVVPRPAVAAKVPPAPQPLSAEEQAIADRRAAKRYAVVAIHADVHLGERPLTELWWSDEAGAHRALSNVDFRLFSAVREWETERDVFLWLQFVAAADWAVGGPPPAAFAQAQAAGLALDPNRPDYVLLDSAGAPAADDPTLAALDYAHALVTTDRARLEAELRASEAAAAARDAEAARPKPKQSVTLRFWLRKP